MRCNGEKKYNLVETFSCYYLHIIRRTRKKGRNDNMASLAMPVTTRRDCLAQELAEEFVQPVPKSE